MVETGEGAPVEARELQPPILSYGVILPLCHPQTDLLRESARSSEEQVSPHVERVLVLLFRALLAGGRVSESAARQDGSSKNSLAAVVAIQIILSCGTRSALRLCTNLNVPLDCPEDCSTDRFMANGLLDRQASSPPVFFTSL